MSSVLQCFEPANVVSTVGGAAVAADEMTANEAVANQFTSVRFIDLSPVGVGWTPRERG
jgi:hypothetical protein